MRTWAWVSSTKRVRPERLKKMLPIVEEQKSDSYFQPGEYSRPLVLSSLDGSGCSDAVTNYAYVSWKQPLVNTDLSDLRKSFILRST